MKDKMKKKILIQLADNKMLNWKHICEKAGLNYRTFCNAKYHEFATYSDKNCETLLNTLWTEWSFLENPLRCGLNLYVHEDISETLYALVQDYYFNRKKDMLWQRESSLSTIYAKGQLIGFLTASGLDMEEADNTITILKQNSREVVLCFKKEGECNERG